MSFLILSSSALFGSDTELFFAIESERVETLFLSETYNEFGFKVSPAEAGDAVVPYSEKAVALIKQLGNNRVVAESIITAYHDSEYYDQVLSLLSENCQVDVDYFHYRETIRGFNYFDGTWHTIVIEHPYYDPAYFEVPGADAFRTAIEEMVWDRKDQEYDYYVSPGYHIRASHAESSWATYIIEEV